MREKFNISRSAVQHPQQVVAFWLAVIAAGILAYSSLKYALFPNISYPVVVVSAQKASLNSALNTEANLTNPLEKSLKTLPNIKEIYSTTYPQQSTINIVFTPGTVLENAAEQTKNILANFRQFKTEVFALNLNESPVISYALSSDQIDISLIKQIAKAELIPNLEKLQGVLKVNLLGDSSIKNSHKKEDGSYLSEKFPTLVHFQGKNALALEIVKKSDANTLDVVALVQQEIQKLQQRHPNIHFNLAETQAKYIKAATGATIDELFLAVILAVGVIFLFLRTFSATIISALAIPTSLLGTFIVMAIFHFNLETLTLLALTMVIGIVVDDAIVDVENISRLIEQGQDTRSAVINGTNEIGLSVIASTLTIVAVFLPVGLMVGSVGKFFKPFGLTISAAVLFSLLVARTLTPVLSQRWLKPSLVKKREFFLVKSYARLLDWALAHRKTVMAIALASFLVGIAFIPFIPKGFVPILDRGEFNVMFSTALPRINIISSSNSPSGSVFNWMDDLAKSPEEFLLKRTMSAGRRLEKMILNIPDIESAFTTAGINGQPNQGKIHVKMKAKRTRNTVEMQDYIRQHLPQLKGVSFSVEDIPFVQTDANKQLQLAIQGQDLGILLEAAQNLKTQVAKISDFKDVALSNSTIDAESPFKIEHLGGERMIYLSANLSRNLALEDATLKVEKLSSVILPQEVKLRRWGNSADSSDVLVSFGFTLLLSTILLLLVLFLLFGRLLEPIVIGLSLPLAIVGAMFGLWITRSDFGIISLLGLIFLLGLLSKNSILLLDYIKRLRVTGTERTLAIIESGKIRLRPIIMTTAATILGMLPITFGIGAGAELRQPMAVAIVGGLLTSTLLSLIVVPVLYTLLDDFWYQNKFR
jgi:multidrug efflux pump subunit AcrB